MWFAYFTALAPSDRTIYICYVLHNVCYGPELCLSIGEHIGGGVCDSLEWCLCLWHSRPVRKYSQPVSAPFPQYPRIASVNDRLNDPDRRGMIVIVWCATSCLHDIVHSVSLFMAYFSWTNRQKHVNSPRFLMQFMDKQVARAGSYIATLNNAQKWNCARKCKSISAVILYCLCLVSLKI